MRKIIVTMFVSLDGVLQAPGGQQEDPTHGFKYGGWSMNGWDDMMTGLMTSFMNRPFDLLLGRKTYEIFAAYWPYKNDLVGTNFNKASKFVVSHQQLELKWKNSNLVNNTKQLADLKKEEGNDLWVHGSGNLVQTLLAEQLVDEIYEWRYPITLGKGKKLFAEGTQPLKWKVLETKISEGGHVISHLSPEGKIEIGPLEPDDPSPEEIERRRKMHNEQ